MKKNSKMSLDCLTKGNIWTIDETELNQMILDAKKSDDFAENESHYMNIIRTVFDIQYLNREDEKKIAQLEAMHYEIFSSPSEGENNAIAIRKHPIKKITDLTLENITHLEPYEVLDLIDKNMGTGWKGLPLAIQDIIESNFFVDCSVLPATTMHRAGGIIDRRKEDGYEVLEIVRGTWIEAVFIKEKPKVERVKYNSGLNNFKGMNGDDNLDDNLEEELEDEDDDMDDDLEDRVPDQDDDDMDDDLDETNPQIEENIDLEDPSYDDDDE
ncbi:MAG: hypothetical protein J5663_02580 [Bacteroidaceae bacterium]|nr:hypothetical protein [Bacteroidaceae bacterium]